MPLPNINNNNLQEFLNNDLIIEETIKQIIKDFAIFGITLNFPEKSENIYSNLHIQLTKQITVLAQNNFSKLLSVLYQIDISEKDIEKTTKELTNYNEVEVIAHQIIVRELKKVITRKYFKINNNTNENN